MVTITVAEPLRGADFQTGVEQAATTAVERLQAAVRARLAELDAAAPEYRVYVASPAGPVQVQVVDGHVVATGNWELRSEFVALDDCE